MKKILLVFVMTILLAAGRAGALDTIPVDEIKPGMKGTGYSVFKGAEPEPFVVEVVGVVKKWRSDRDLILAEISGQGLEVSGVVAGMSGSPIYMDGKLGGALGYGWAGSK